MADQACLLVMELASLIVVDQVSFLEALQHPQSELQLVFLAVLEVLIS